MKYLRQPYFIPSFSMKIIWIVNENLLTSYFWMRTWFIVNFCNPHAFFPLTYIVIAKSIQHFFSFCIKKFLLIDFHFQSYQERYDKMDGYFWIMQKKKILSVEIQFYYLFTLHFLKYQSICCYLLKWSIVLI